jgi:hypothetical protein
MKKNTAVVFKVPGFWVNREHLAAVIRARPPLVFG